MELKDVRLKLLDDLTSEEADFLREHKDELNEEDLEAYRPLFGEEAEIEEPEVESSEEKPDSEEPQTTFKSQEEIDAYLEKELGYRDWETIGRAHV